MTYTNPQIVGVMLRNDGVYPGDPQMARIYSYEHTTTGRLCFAVFDDYSRDDMDQAPHARDIELLSGRSAVKDTEATQIIKQALVDNGQEAPWASPMITRHRAVEIYGSSCSIDELTEQIVDRLRSRGAFRDD